LKVTKTLEKNLASIPYEYADGVAIIWNANNEKWKEAMLLILIDKKAALSITGQVSRCSKSCRNEDGDSEYKGYKFIDKSRFRLWGCPHASAHV